MWEVKSKRSGKINILNDEQLDTLKRSGLAKLYNIEEIKPARTIKSPFTGDEEPKPKNK